MTERSLSEATMDGPKKLTRAREGRMIGGVCAGLGRYFEVDATLIRLGLALTVCLAGTGVLAYVLAWIIIPEE